MLALHFVYNSPVIKHNRHGLALVPTTSFCTLLWGRHGSEGKAMLASNFVYNSPVLKHNRHGFALVPTNSFCTLLWGYLNKTHIFLFSLHSRHGAERRAMLASNFVYNSPVLKHNRHSLALVPTTSFCTMLWGYLNITPISLFSVHGRHGAEGRAMLASKKLYNSPFLKHNRHVLALVPTTSCCTLLRGYLNITPISLFSLHGRHRTEGRAMLA